MQIFENMDCMEGMKRYPDKYFDLAIVDPPYGIGDFTHNKKERRYKGNIVTATKFNVYWNDDIPNKEYFQELKRVSKNQIIWGANYYNCFNPGGAIVWYKHTKHPKISACEIASLSNYKKVFYIDYEWYSLNRSETTIHPCQKPVGLYREVIKLFCKEGYKILDTHVGSASSLIAFESFGLDYVGFEIDKEYFEKAKERIENEREKLKLFNPSFEY